MGSAYVKTGGAEIILYKKKKLRLFLRLGKLAQSKPNAGTIYGGSGGAGVQAEFLS